MLSLRTPVSIFVITLVTWGTVFCVFSFVFFVFWFIYLTLPNLENEPVC